MHLPKYLLAFVMMFSAAAQADAVKVENAWLRATLPGQKVVGGFMDLTAEGDVELVGARTDAAESVELHFMRMDGGVMEMRELKSIHLPKGKTVHLAPGGFHAMLIGVKAPLKAGDKVPMILTFDDGQGHHSTQEISIRVSARQD